MASGEADRTSVTVVREEDAAGKAKDGYTEIGETLKIDFVPNMHLALGTNPDCLEMTWRKVQSVMSGDGQVGGSYGDSIRISYRSGSPRCVINFAAIALSVAFLDWAGRQCSANWLLDCLGAG